MLFVPAGERSEEEEADERKDDGDDSEDGVSKPFAERAARENTHIKYGKTMLSLKVFATQIRFSGS